jgi:hypothetical protein
MNSKTLNGAQRISKSQGRAMVFVAVFFDFLALLTVLLTIMLMIYYVGSNFGYEMGLVNEVTEEVSSDFPMTMEGAGGVASKLAVAGVSATAKAALGIGSLFFIIPIFYTVISLLSTLLAYFVFTIWFLLKGVNMWSFDNGQRVGINLVSGIIELVPILNILPAITVMVWRHVKISQKEDQVKEADQAQKIQRQLNTLPQGSV